MKELTVTYHISDEDERRLRKIKNKYKMLGINMTEEELFAFIMTVSSIYDIDSKLKFHETMLESREV